MTPNIEEELLTQFYDWEMWGRGYALWDAPVHLEPPFRSFDGHYALYQDLPDDGRRPTLLGYLGDLFQWRVPTAPSAQLTKRTEAAVRPQPRYLRGAPGLVSFQMALPQDLDASEDAIAAWLLSLRTFPWPVAFELVATEHGIVLQIGVRQGGEASLVASTQASFPGLVLVRAEDVIENVFYQECIAVFELALRREFVLPVAIPSRRSDPLALVITALEGTSVDDMAAIQVLFERADHAWAESIIRAVTDGEGGSFFENAPHIAALGKRKALEPLFGVVLRIAVGAATDEAAQARAQRIGGALEQFGAVDRNSFTLLTNDYEELASDFIERQSRRSGMLLGLDELAAIVHPPSARVHSRALVGRLTRRTKAAPETSATGLLLGTNSHAGTHRTVYLAREWQRRHVHIVGASGSGKTNLLLQLLLRSAERGDGFALLDPHGDLVEDLLARLPPARLNDIALFDPSDVEYPVGFNVLAAHSELEKTLLGSDLVGIFRRLSTSWGDQMHAVLANAIQAILESERGGTVVDLRRFLVDPGFRTDFLKGVQDEETVYYWKKEFPLLRGQPQGPILTRLDSFLRPKLIRRMVEQRENRIDFRALMDRGGIFLAKLAQGAIGEENAALLGSFLVAKFHQAAIGRQELAPGSRRDFLLAVDEFQNFVTPSMASLLSGGRKFGVGLLLAHQDLRSVERRDSEVLSALLANAGTRIVFRVGDADARALSDGFAEFSAEDLRTLAIGEAIVRFGRADHDFNVMVELAKPVDHADALRRREQIVAVSREHYGKRATPSDIGDLRNEEARESKDARDDSDPPPVSSTPPSPAPPPPPRAEPTPRKAPEEQTLGRGGAQHKYMQELVKRFAEAQGYRATIEKPTATGGSVDVALDRADGSIAVEISVTSTTAYESGNVAKCLAAGYSRVVVLASERRRLDAIAKVVRPALLDSERARVDFLLPEEFLTYLTAQTPPPPSEEQVGGYKVKVSYKKPTDEDAKARQRAVTEVIARSVKKLDE